MCVCVCVCVYVCMFVRVVSIPVSIPEEISPPAYLVSVNRTVTQVNNRSWMSFATPATSIAIL